MFLIPVGDLPVYLMPYVFVCESYPVLKAQSPTLKITKETNIGIAIILINMFLTLNVSVQNDLRLVPKPGVYKVLVSDAQKKKYELKYRVQ